MIYITGDTHGMIDWEKINTTNFPEQLAQPIYTDWGGKCHYCDYLIILGDFGGVWGDEDQDNYILKTYNKRRFTTLFIDGNHENHDLLDKYPVEEWNGGKVHFISEKVIHLMRGQVYTIGGIKLFTMGGAESTDRKYRKEGKSWWPREMPSDEEYEEALRNLEKHSFDVDVVLTHCAPEGYIGKNMRPVYNSDISRMLADNMASICDRSGNRLTKFLDELITVHKLKFNHWYFGHYHRDMDWDKFSLVFSKVRPLYDQIIHIYIENRRVSDRNLQHFWDFAGSIKYISFCAPGRKPMKINYHDSIVVKIDDPKEMPDVDGVAKFALDAVSSYRIITVQTGGGLPHGISFAKAVEYYFKHKYVKDKVFVVYVRFSSEKTANSPVDNSIYESILEALSKRDEKE